MISSTGLTTEQMAQKLANQLKPYEENEGDNSLECFSTARLPDVDENLRDIQDIIKNSQKITTDPKVLSAINEVLASSSQSLKDTDTQKHVKEFLQENNKILEGLGLPKFSAVPSSTTEEPVKEVEDHFEYDCQESEEMQLELYQYLNKNPSCNCFALGASDEINKINDLIDHFNFAALPKTYSGQFFSKLNYSLLKASFQFRQFYSHYKGLIQKIDKRLLINPMQALILMIMSSFSWILSLGLQRLTIPCKVLLIKML